MSEATERWLAFSQEDLRVAEILFDEEIYNQVCFHAQQCVEKSLKGLLVYQNRQPPRTHNITDLLSLLPAEMFADLRNELGQMSYYYIPTRYPDALPGTLPEGLPGRDQAVEALRLAQTVLQQVTGTIQQQEE